VLLYYALAGLRCYDILLTGLHPVLIYYALSELKENHGFKMFQNEHNIFETIWN
jgi:hypothetical protein